MAAGTDLPLGERLVAPITNFSDLLWGGTWNGEAVIPFPPLALILLGAGVWFMIGLRFYPLVKLVGGGVPLVMGTPIGDGFVLETQFIHPVIAPALIIVGSLVMTSAAKIDWARLTDAIPAFLAVIIMPLTFSITDGIAFGFISYAILKLVKGEGREVSGWIYLFAALFVLRYALPAL